MINANTKIILAFTGGICLGGGVGYYVAKRTLEHRAEEEIQKVRDMFNRLREEDAEKARSDWSSQPDSEEIDTAEDLDDRTQESLAEAAATLGYGNPDDVRVIRRPDPNYLPPTEQEPLGDEDFPEEDQIDQDLRQEVEYVKQLREDQSSERDPNDVTQWDRSPSHPYVITDEEFRMDRPDHEKLSLNYYAGDGVLTEADDSYIPDLEGTVGRENLIYFGLASGDDRVLHIRNERVSADFEVTLDDGKYEHVIGFNINDEPEVPKRTIKKMRSHE